MPMQYSPLESNRFNLRILRGLFPKVEPYDLLRTIVDERADVAIFRLPSSQQYQLSQLSLLPFPVIVADTLMSFECDLREFPAAPLRNSGLVVKQATMEDVADLQELVDLSFKDYRTHYHSNPLFDPALVLDGYKEWAMSSLQADSRQVCFLFYFEGQAIGYGTCELHDTYCEGALYGARPNIPVKNLYADMINYTKEYTWNLGLRRIRGTTQAQNLGGQRAWLRAGFMPHSSNCTVHINALLSKYPERLEAATAALAEQTSL